MNASVSPGIGAEKHLTFRGPTTTKRLFIEIPREIQRFNSRFLRDCSRMPFARKSPRLCYARPTHRPKRSRAVFSRRIVSLALVAALAAISLVALIPRFAARAPGANSLGADPIMGSWHVTVSFDGGRPNVLALYTPCGVEIAGGSEGHVAACAEIREQIPSSETLAV